MLFERQINVLRLSMDKWFTYLIGALSNEIENLIAREPEENFLRLSLYSRHIVKVD